MIFVSLTYLVMLYFLPSKRTTKIRLVRNNTNLILAIFC